MSCQFKWCISKICKASVFIIFLYIVLLIFIDFSFLTKFFLLLILYLLLKAIQRLQTWWYIVWSVCRLFISCIFLIFFVRIIRWEKWKTVFKFLLITDYLRWIAHGRSVTHYTSNWIIMFIFHVKEKWCWQLISE